MLQQNGISVILVILLASFSSTSATFEWLADLFGFGSSNYSPGFGGTGSIFGFGGNRRPRPGTSFGTAHGSGHISEGSGFGGSNYLGGGWTGPGNTGYNNYYGAGGLGLLGNLGLSGQNSLFGGPYGGGHLLQNRFGRGGPRGGYHPVK